MPTKPKIGIFFFDLDCQLHDDTKNTQARIDMRDNDARTIRLKRRRYATMVKKQL